MHFQMLISFPVKAGVQEELREKGTLFFTNENMNSIQFSFKTFCLLCVP